MSNNNIYSAVYSGIAVYEVMCRGIAVMRRKDDSYLNATQILKVAGIDKGKRTKILEREVLIGDHEKIQGGYGKYQGTWVPFKRGQDLAIKYKVEPYLRTLFEYNVPEGETDTTPTKEMIHAAIKAKETLRPKKIAASSPKPSPAYKRGRSSDKPSGSTGGSQPYYHGQSMTPSPLHPSFNVSSPIIPPSPQWHTDHPPRKRFRTNNSPPPLHEFDDDGPYRQSQPPSHPNQPYIHHQPYYRPYPPRQQRHHHHHQRSDPYGDMSVEYDRGPRQGQFLERPPEEPVLEGVEKYRNILMSIFLSDDQDDVPDLLKDQISPPDLDINLMIDDQGHTALHWAAALARISVLDLLVKKQADIRRVNFSGESALVRAVLVTNNFDRQSFPHVLEQLHSAIPLVDRKNRTLLHHIAVTAGIRGREASSRYYMECVLEWIARHGGDFASIIDIQDKNGDTALTIAARMGDRYLSKVLIDVGANREIENKVGLKAEDFGLDEVEAGMTGPLKSTRPPAAAAASSNEPTPLTMPGTRGKDLVNVVQKMVDELDLEFSHEIMARQGQLQETQALLRHATSELSETRRVIKHHRTQMLQLAEAQQKIKNLEQALDEESQKTRIQKGYSDELRSNDNATEDVDRLFDIPDQESIPSSTKEDSGAPKEDTNASKDDSNAPKEDSGAPKVDAAKSDSEKESKAENDIILLQARVKAYEQNEKELAQELVEIKDQSLDKELQCRKVISICCNIPLDNVDEMLVPLTLAVESDGASLDLSRVAGFMSKVKQQDGVASAAPVAL
ncbi:transcriptional regulator swi6 [Mortierella polycephala]|uniref:Transcriptional regulator swi6 n=1 Tax=Mortierella polycephala TaxID=41804 RepID=A0A9P6PX57_9FUNG|nr:transcriptional regulator swi6 [Mortierella polycephala]